MLGAATALLTITGCGNQSDGGPGDRAAAEVTTKEGATIYDVTRCRDLVGKAFEVGSEPGATCLNDEDALEFVGLFDCGGVQVLTFGQVGARQGEVFVSPAPDTTRCAFVR